MKYFTSAHMEANEPVPTVEWGGTKRGIPVIRFGEGGDQIHLTEIADLPAWLREFASRLEEFAELVEVRAMLAEIPKADGQ